MNDQPNNNGLAPLKWAGTTNASQMRRFEIFPGVFVEIDTERYRIDGALNMTPAVMPDEFTVTMDLKMTNLLEGGESKTQNIVVLRSKV